MLSRAPVLVSLAALALLSALNGVACSSSDTTGGTTGTGGHSGTPGGPVSGNPDAHCGTKSQVTSEAACHPTPTGSGGGSSSSSGSGSGSSSTTGAGGSTGAGGDASEYGETLENAEGDDDDCKYHVKWTSTDIYANTDVTVTAVITTKSDGKPATSGEVDVEAFLNDTHPAPNSDTKVTETTPGTYTIGPVRFDKAGKWTLRFHIHEECSDLTEDSPHGHVAFYVNIP
jgi:hypothetical protein